MIRRAGQLGLALAVFALGCGSGGGTDDATSAGPPTAGTPVRLAAGAPRGAVLFLLDTVRRDRLSAYGYERETSPAIDALAESGVLFENVVSYAPWTLPSVAAILSADYPPRVFDADLRLTRSAVESIAAAGYRTAAFTEGGYVARRWGMDRGFDVFVEDSGPPDSPSRSAATFAAARAWLAENADAPFFLLIHTYEAHMPYTHRGFAEGLDPGRVGPTYELPFLDRVRSGEIALTAEERAYIRALYDGDIREADRRVGEFLHFLEEFGLADETVVVVTSDHGEEMGDEFELFIGGHGHSLRDNLLLVPLVIRDPTRSFVRRRVTTQVRTIDVLPTVAELLDAAPGVATAGRSLVPVLSDAEPNHRTAMSGETNRGFARVGVRDGRYKYIRAVDPEALDVDRRKGLDVPARQLYDVVADPAEDRNLIGLRPRVARRLDHEVGAWFNGLGAPPAVSPPPVDDEELLDRLRTLGYVD